MFAIIAALVLQAAPTAARPPSAAEADARCLIMFSFLGSRGDPSAAEYHKSLVLYFTGKLKGRDDAVDIASTVINASKAAQAAQPKLNNRAELARCTADVKEAGDGLRSIRSTAAAKP